MANQAIALQARAPSASSGGNVFAQNMQMMNMMAQRTAAERQAATAQQALEVSQASEARNVAGEARQVTKAELDAAEQRLKYYRNRASEVRSPEGYQNWLSEVDKEDPGMAKSFRINLPPEQFSPQTLDFMVGDYSDRFAARFGKATTSTVVTPEGGVLGVTSSSIPGASFSTPVPDISRPLAPTAPAAGVQPMAPRQTPTAQPAPQTPTGGMFQRMSATGGQPQGAAPQNADPLAPLLASLDEAKKTGNQIGADVVEQLRQLDPRVTPDVIDAFLAQNGIKVAPGGGMRSAVYRGESPMAAQQVQYNPNAYAPTRAKSPMVSPMPGSAMVPLGRVAAEARAGRQTPQEAYDLKLAEARAARDIGPKPLTPVQDAKLRANISKDFNAAQTTLDAMLNPVSGVMAAAEAVRNLSPEQKEAVTGYSGYVPSVTDSSKTADTKIKNLLGKVTELGKAQASMSGAIGAMAVQEWTIVRNMIANLDVNGMSARDLDNQIDIIVSAAQGAANRVRDQYLNQYAEEFDRYPKRFQLKDPQAAAKPAAGAGKIPRYNPASRSFE
jgi:hypothetical protein